MIIIAITVNALAASAYLVVVVSVSTHHLLQHKRAYIVGSPILCCGAQVERAKKCLDFAATLYLIHFIVCFAYSGFSRSLAW